MVNYGINTERNKRICRMYKGGMTGTKLAVEFGITHAVIYRILHRAGLDVKNNAHITEDDVAKIVSLNSAGCNDAEIARQIGVPTTTVNYHRTLMGLPTIGAGSTTGAINIIKKLIVNPDLTNSEIARRAVCSPDYVRAVRYRLRNPTKGKEYARKYHDQHNELIGRETARRSA
jgi:DNA-binding CsgD family transcriptional regulator